MSELHYTFNVV